MKTIIVLQYDLGNPSVQRNSKMQNYPFRNIPVVLNIHCLEYDSWEWILTNGRSIRYSGEEETTPQSLKEALPSVFAVTSASAGTTSMIYSRSHSPRELHVEFLDG